MNAAMSKTILLVPAVLVGLFSTSSQAHGPGQVVTVGVAPIVVDAGGVIVTFGAPPPPPPVIVYERPVVYAPTQVVYAPAPVVVHRQRQVVYVPQRETRVVYVDNDGCGGRVQHGNAYGWNKKHKKHGHGHNDHGRRDNDRHDNDRGDRQVRHGDSRYVAMR